jgi:hypothetical protein
VERRISANTYWARSDSAPSFDRTTGAGGADVKVVDRYRVRRPHRAHYVYSFRSQVSRLSPTVEFFGSARADAGSGRVQVHAGHGCSIGWRGTTHDVCECLDTCCNDIGLRSRDRSRVDIECSQSDLWAAIECAVFPNRAERSARSDCSHSSSNLATSRGHHADERNLPLSAE